jgi:RNA polymerase sigma-70 factor (ECF subfamily)
MSAPDTETSQNLQQWNRGDQAGLEALLARHLTWIQSRVRKRLGPKLRQMVESTDVVQEAAVQFFKYSPRFVVYDDAKFRGFIARVIENILCDKHDWFTARRREIARQRPLPSDTILYLDSPRQRVKTPSKSVERHEREAWIRLGLELLDQEDREVIVLRQWDSLSFDEIAKEFSIHTDAARMRYNRAVGRLGKKVGELRRGNLPIEEGSPLK